METVLKLTSGVARKNSYESREIVSVYDGFSLHEKFVEELSLKKKTLLTPVELPGNESERMTFIHQYPTAMEDEDLDDTDLDLEEDIDLDEDLDDDVDEDIDDAELSDDLDLEDEELEEDDDIV